MILLLHNNTHFDFYNEWHSNYFRLFSYNVQSKKQQHPVDTTFLNIHLCAITHICTVSFSSAHNISLHSILRNTKTQHTITTFHISNSTLHPFFTLISSNHDQNVQHTGPKVNKKKHNSLDWGQFPWDTLWRLLYECEHPFSSCSRSYRSRDRLPIDR